ncbi:hypothetical protein [Pacificispira sp.]|uniref:hypothetical protein n=1 Tax=Pacificispira sp. TaxID=2888761 RepID=UPI003BAC652A
MKIEFVSETNFPWSGVGNLEIPFNTFRIGDKWAMAMERCGEIDPHNYPCPEIFIDGDKADIALKIVGWAYGPFETMADHFGSDNHGWRNSNQKQSPKAWLTERLEKIYGAPITSTTPVSVLMFEPLTSEERERLNEELDED